MQLAQTKSVTVEIAKTILAQIKSYDQMLLWACGARNFTALSEEKLGSGNYQLGGVQMDVSGLKFKGKVIVRLIANDTYTVEIGYLSKVSYKWNIKKSVPDIYSDQLGEIIDSLVER